MNKKKSRLQTVTGIFVIEVACELLDLSHNKKNH